VLRENVRDVALDYLALGLDPKKATFYRQSDVPEVTELAWILATVTGMGLLERAHSYKDKVQQGITPTVGLFTYPVLMAADILIVRSDVVPVGKDQVQHLEMTQDMAGKFNRAFGEVFPIPDYRLDKESNPELVPKPWERPLMLLNCGRNTLYPASTETICVPIHSINSGFGSKNRFEPPVTGNQTP